MNIFSGILYARACVYEEAYRVETRSGGESRTIAAFLVGVFDAPLIMAILLTLESLLIEPSIIREMFSNNLTSIFSIAFTFFVLLFEYTYYRLLKIGAQHRSELKKCSLIGILYAAVVSIGGSVLIFLIF